MNITKLFELQKQLDTHIEEKHPREAGRDRLAEKVLALQVELGECCQEWRGFKFWSKDQAARTEKLLEELVDVFHFILSIGLELGFDTADFSEIEPAGSIAEEFQRVFSFIVFVDTARKSGTEAMWFAFLFNSFMQLGAALGFSFAEIERAYFAKNLINHRRQNNSY